MGRTHASDRLTPGLHAHQAGKRPLEPTFPCLGNPVSVQEPLDRTFMLECCTVSGDFSFQQKWKTIARKYKAGIAFDTEFDDDEIANAHNKGVVIRRSGAV